MQPVTTGASAKREWISPRDFVRLLSRRPGVLAASAAIGVLLSALSVWSSQPMYRATSTLLLDTELPQGRTLSNLSALIRVPSATSELVLLKSTPLLELCVQTPSDGRVASPKHPEYDRRLGLTTLVEDLSNTPLATMQHQPSDLPPTQGRLFADLDADQGAPRELVVQFPVKDRVRVGRAHRWLRFGVAPMDVEEFDYRPGLPIRYRDAKLRLDSTGDVVGGSFLVRAQTSDDAVSRLVGSIQAIEQERGSGVILVTVDDSDPFRAADQVNAVVRNYIQTAETRGLEKTARTVDEIEGLLLTAEDEYAHAQNELIRLKERFPEAVDANGSINALLEQIKNFETWHRKVRIDREEIQGLILRLQRGEMGALSRAGSDLDEPFTRKLLETIVQLSSEQAQLDRANIGAYGALLAEKLFAQQEELVRTSRRVEYTRSVVDQLEEGITPALAAIASETNDRGDVLSDPLTTRFLDRYADLRVERDQLESEYLPGAPAMQDNLHAITQLEEQILRHLKTKLELLERSLGKQREVVELHQKLIDDHPESEREAIDAATVALREQALDHLYSRLGGLTAEEEEYRGQIASLNDKLGRMPESAAKLARPKIRAELAESAVKMLTASLQEARISHASAVRTVEVVSPAQPPSSPHTPRTLFNIGVGFLVGLLAGFALAFGLELLRDSIHEEGTLADTTGLTVLGRVPHHRRAPRAAAPLLPLRDDPVSVAAEAYRSLRAKLRFAFGAERRLRTVATTSCAAGEGKTTVNANLALAFAGGGERVLLVDADLRSPAIHKAFGLDADGGLSEVLADGADWRVLRHVGVARNLDVLCAGDPPDTPGDLLSGERIDQLFAEWKESYGVVVFDLPRGLGLADVDAFAYRLDGLLIVYRTGGASRRQLAELVVRLQESGAPLIGSVLNGVRGLAPRLHAPAARRLRRSA